MQQVSDDSNGKIRLVPGALYTSIKLLHEQGLVREVTNNEDTRRRYYELTNKGLTTLNTELEYYDNSVRLARQRNIYGSISNAS
jgi:DNA-binding PadR family transcriptional regulator